MLSPLYVTTLLVSSIAAIILLSARFKFNTFFVLLIVAASVGFTAGFDGEKVINMLKTGFGSTLEKIGLLIIFGTTLGILLEKSNATLRLDVFSHTNDSYFWVISKFSNLDTATTLRAHSTASALMAIVAFLSVWIAAFLL